MSKKKRQTRTKKPTRSTPMVMSLRECPRCGTAHEIKVIRLKRPSGQLTHYAMCHIAFEPVFLLERTKDCGTSKFERMIQA